MQVPDCDMADQKLLAHSDAFSPLRCEQLGPAYIYAKGVHGFHCSVTAPGMVSCWGPTNCLAQEFHSIKLKLLYIVI